MNLQQLKDTATFLKEKGIYQAQIGIVLGTGLGNLATKIDAEIVIDYEAIPNFPVSTVEMHKGKLIYGRVGGKWVLAMQGRFHYYEGYSMEETVFPIRVMKLLGITSLLISNAAGAINLDFNKGNLMLITDHVNLFSSNPLLGQNKPELGTRFPDMSEPYSKQLSNCLRSVAKDIGINLREGVYVTAQGPMLETPAEYRMLKQIGGDAVGMSTVPEVIAANHIGLPCCAVSVLTDECDPDNLKPVDISEIIAVAGKAELKLTELFVGLIESI